MLPFLLSLRGYDLNVSRYFDEIGCTEENTFHVSMPYRYITPMDTDYHTLKAGEFVCIYGSFLIAANISFTADVYTAYTDEETRRDNYTITKNVSNPLAVLPKPIFNKYHGLDAKLYPTWSDYFFAVTKPTFLGESLAVARCSEACRIQTIGVMPSFRFDADFYYDKIHYKYDVGIKSIFSTKIKDSAYLYDENKLGKYHNTSIIVYLTSYANQKLNYSYKKDNGGDAFSFGSTISKSIAAESRLNKKYPNADMKNLSDEYRLDNLCFLTNNGTEGYLTTDDYDMFIPIIDSCLFQTYNDYLNYSYGDYKIGSTVSWDQKNYSFKPETNDRSFLFPEFTATLSTEGGVFTLKNINQTFPTEKWPIWYYIVIGVGCLVFVIIVIVTIVAICKCAKRKKDKSSDASAKV